MVIQTESGLKSHRTEYVRESSQGDTPADPTWNLFSDTVRSFDWAPDTNVESTRGIGDADPKAFLKGSETHELTVEYDLQTKDATGLTFLDGSGNPNDAVTDGLERDSDNNLKNSHTIVDREKKTAISAEETVNGSTSYATRIYTVAKGALVDGVTLSGDPGSQNPVLVEVTYQAEKVRSYQIDQPDSGTLLGVSSDDSTDTTQSVTIEGVNDADSDATETISLDGTTFVSGSTVWKEIDAVELDAETDGDVTLAINTATEASPAEGDALSKLYGADAYSGMEGDLGVPVTGSGSHASAIGEDFELITGDTVETPSGTDLAFDINSVEFSVSNNLDTTQRISTLKSRHHVGQRDTEVSATVLGESESHTKVLDHLQVVENNVVWTLTGGSLQADDAALMDPGSRTIEAGEAVMTLDCTFEGKGVTVS